jgi:hypothetical protein
MKNKLPDFLFEMDDKLGINGELNSHIYSDGIVPLENFRIGIHESRDIALNICRTSVMASMTFLKKDTPSSAFQDKRPPSHMLEIMIKKNESTHRRYTFQFSQFFRLASLDFGPSIFVPVITQCDIFGFRCLELFFCRIRRLWC